MQMDNIAEKVASLQKRASDVNSKIIAIKSKQELLKTQISQKVKKLGIDFESMSLDDLRVKISKIEEENKEKIIAFEAELQKAENLVKTFEI